MSNKTETTAGTWAAIICVGLVLLFCWVKCKGDSEELDQAVQHANAVAFEADQLIEQGNALISSIEAQEQINLVEMQSALYGSGDDFFNPQVSFGNSETRNDPFWVTRNKNLFAALEIKVRYEKKAVEDAKRDKDTDGVTDHTAELEKAKSSLELQLSILNKYGIKP